MIAAASLAFPGSKTLAAWWSQLASYHPSHMWVGHFFIHRLEILAEVVEPESVDPLHRMLLQAVDQEFRSEENQSQPLSVELFLERLDERLHLTPGLIARLISDLRGLGLLTLDPQPALSEMGRQALAHGTFPRTHMQRRDLAFAERLHPDGSRLQSPHFLALSSTFGQRWQPDAGTALDLALLDETLRQPQSWRDVFAFPQEIRTIADPRGPGADLWQRVAVDRPERLLTAVIAVGPGPDRLLLFAARQDGWELMTGAPVGTLPWAGRTEFADLAEPSNWPRAWQTWCQSRRLPQEEVDACRLTQSQHRLEVQIPATLHARLAAARNEILKGETWLLAGDGYVRAAVNVRIETAKRE